MKIENMFDINNKVFLITGAYGRIGSKICKFLLENGATAVAVGRNNKKLMDLKRELKDIEIFKTNLEDEAEIVSLWKKLKKSYSKIDVLINNAAQASSNTFENLSADEWDKIMSINVRGMFLMCREGVTSNILKEKSSIINISSIYGIVSPDQRIYGKSQLNCSLVYATSKSSVIQLTKYLSTYLADKKIRVNCISPGGIFNNQPEYFLKQYVGKTPLRRMGKEEDIFGAITLLSSESASGYITGENIVIDGGFTVW